MEYPDKITLYMSKELQHIKIMRLITDIGLNCLK